MLANFIDLLFEQAASFAIGVRATKVVQVFSKLLTGAGSWIIYLHDFPRVDSAWHGQRAARFFSFMTVLRNRIEDAHVFDNLSSLRCLNFTVW